MDRGRGGWLLWIAAAALLALAATRLLGAGGQQEPVRVDAPGGSSRGAASGSGADGAGGAGRAAGADGAGGVAGAGGAAGANGASRLYVHVAGSVRRPGLYRLVPGERVAAAIERAGGPGRRADLARVNLAARVQDGQQVVVPRLGAVAAGGSGGAAGAGAGGVAGAGSKLSLAAATVEQLDGLDGIGPTLAKRIVEFREKHGGFRSIGQLRDVEGIGEKRFQALREALGP